MARFAGEAEYLRRVIAIGDQWGYGNCIAVLQAAWALKLLKDTPGFEVRSACLGARMDLDTANDYHKMGKKKAIVALTRYACLED